MLCDHDYKVMLWQFWEGGLSGAHVQCRKCGDATSLRAEEKRATVVEEQLAPDQISFETLPPQVGS